MNFLELYSDPEVNQSPKILKLLNYSCKGINLFDLKSSTI